MSSERVRAGYKQTEVGVIPGDWEILDLALLCTLQRGFDITEATRSPGPIPVYSSSGISYYHNKPMVAPPGLVTGRKGILGKVFLVHEPFWPHDTTLWVKDFRGNSPAYVALVLESFHLERLDAATSVPTLNRNNLAGHLIIFAPTKAEQEAIAEALSDADALIEALEQLLVKKRQIKQGAMQELLTGKKRLPGFEVKPGYKQTEVGLIPEDWAVRQFQAISSLERGKFTARPRNDPRYYGGPTPFIQTGDITNSGGRITTYSQTLNADGLRVSKLFSKGTLFFTIAANIGDVGIANFDTACPDSIVAVTPAGGTNLRWLSYELTSRKKLFESLASHNAQLNINLEKLRPYLLPFPATEEQKAIATILSDMDAEISSLTAKLGKARAIKQGMMQELLTGRIRLV